MDIYTKETNVDRVESMRPKAKAAEWNSNGMPTVCELHSRHG